MFRKTECIAKWFFTRMLGKVGFYPNVWQSGFKILNNKNIQMTT